MKPLTYGSLFSGTECMSAATKQVLDFLILRAIATFPCSDYWPLFPFTLKVSVKDFMEWRRSKSKSASEKRLRNGIEELCHTDLTYCGDQSVRLPIEYNHHICTSGFSDYGSFHLTSATFRWEEGENPFVYFSFSPLFFKSLIYAAVTQAHNQNNIKMI